jgi:hypothetical protein
VEKKMEQNETLDLDVKPEVDRRMDSIMLRATRTGNGFKVVHKGIWYYASKHKVQDVVNQKRDSCLFVTIEEENPIQ